MGWSFREHRPPGSHGVPRLAQNLGVLIRISSAFYGTGGPPVVADVAVSHRRIVAIGKLPGAHAKAVIDAKGMAVTPGFIDPQSCAGVRYGS